MSHRDNKGDHADALPTRCAAMYVRMSTEHQQYSTENQSKAILEYANSHRIQIVQRYEDAGKSGLRIEGRPGLKRLIRDIETGTHDFTMVLVYDISRWGRFQDADESAFYEYRCRSRGVNVQYCAEQFENDGSIGSDIQKVVKRRMAAEYSRELSVKVFSGQASLIERGFRQGGEAGFGLQRMLVDQNRTQKFILRRADRKSIQTDRVTLVPGPESERHTVQEIFRLFIHESLNEARIAETLNTSGLLKRGTAWSRHSVHEILINGKYAGDNIWNRKSFKLRQHRIRNAPESWIVCENAFEPLVPRSLFERANKIITARTMRLSDEEIINTIKDLLCQNGYLSASIINASESCPSVSALKARFGSLSVVYSRVGYSPHRDLDYVEVNRRLKDAYSEIEDAVFKEMRNSGSKVEKLSGSPALLVINDEFFASLRLLRHRLGLNGFDRWSARLDPGCRPDLTIAVRMAPGNAHPLDCFLFPANEIPAMRFDLVRENSPLIEAYRFDDLSCLRILTTRSRLQEIWM